MTQQEQIVFAMMAEVLIANPELGMSLLLGSGLPDKLVKGVHEVLSETEDIDTAIAQLEEVGVQLRTASRLLQRAVRITTP